LTIHYSSQKELLTEADKKILRLSVGAIRLAFKKGTIGYISFHLVILFRRQDMGVSIHFGLLNTAGGEPDCLFSIAYFPKAKAPYRCICSVVPDIEHYDRVAEYCAESIRCSSAQQTLTPI
jgi:hypothetical protein